MSLSIIGIIGYKLRRFMGLGLVCLGVAAMAGAISMVFLFPMASAAQISIVGDDSGIGFAGVAPDLSVKNIAPGNTHSTLLHIENQGTQAFPVFISIEDLEGDLVLGKGLVISISEVGGRECYFGPINGLEAIPLGEAVPGEITEYQLLLSLPTAAGNEFQGTSISAKYVFSSRHKVPEPMPPEGQIPVTGNSIMILVPAGVLMVITGVTHIITSPRPRKAL